VRVLDVGRLIEITDYFVICSGATDRQVRTIVQESRQRTWFVGRDAPRELATGRSVPNKP
jgi:ribosomal silencing factor RsfS